MQLTQLGHKTLKWKERKRRTLGEQLIRGDKHILDYVVRGICYDVVAYAKFLLNAQIDRYEIVSTFGKQWLEKFVFTDGDRTWKPGMSIDEGKAVGFYRHTDGKFFHAAISVGEGTHIRGVNNYYLSPGWSEEINLDYVLTDYNKDGSFNFDGTKVDVYISDL